MLWFMEERGQAADVRSRVWSFSLQRELLLTSYRADMEHSDVWDFFQVPTFSFSLRSIPGSEMLKSTSSEVNSLPLRFESGVLDASNLML